MPQGSDQPRSALGSFRLGDWVVEPRLNRLTRGDESIQLELKIMDVLVALAGRPGRLMTRQQLIDAVWGTEFITENTLTHAIAVLRKTLGDNAQKPRFIETIHRRGYRLIADVEPTDSRKSATPGRTTGRPPSANTRSPYPGLASFTTADAPFFFGRESEIEHIWRAITTHRLVAVVGASGVGKSSLVHAGVVPAAPSGWAATVCQPGDSPRLSLVRSLFVQGRRDRAGEPEVRHTVTRIARWRRRHQRALVVIDQFEELFELNPWREQSSFVRLLDTLTRDHDVNLLLALRDDYLLSCHEYEQLKPVFQALVPVSVPKTEALRHLILEPARHRGYLFDDETVVEDMIAGVRDERAALPLLAFTLATMWDRRDSTLRLMTRKSYEEIGGVEGALARHAEATLERIGDGQDGDVRRIFRELITARGARRSRTLEDLLAMFPGDREELARGIIWELVRARLLTSFQGPGAKDGKDVTRVEIAHDSLLTSWPRLVRWRSEDAETVQLFDELHQAARLWDEHGRPPERLWVGPRLHRYLSLEDQIEKRLTPTERAFTSAIVRHRRRVKRNRRVVRTVTIGMLTASLAVIVVLWQMSRHQALRAEAAQLVSLGEKEQIRSAKLAFAIASLELEDSISARRFVIETLWEGPPARFLPSPVNEEWFRSLVNRDDPGMAPGVAAPWAVEFSPDGKHLAVGYADGSIRVFDQRGRIVCSPAGHQAFVFTVRWTPDLKMLVSSGWDEEVKLWSFPSGDLVRELAPGGLSGIFVPASGDRVLIETGRRHNKTTVWRSWPLAGGEPELIRTLQNLAPIPWLIAGHSSVDSSGLHALVYTTENDLELMPLSAGEDRFQVVARQKQPIQEVGLSARGDLAVTTDDQHRVRVWEVETAAVSSRPIREMQAEGDVLSVHLDDSGSKLIAVSDSGTAALWDLTLLPDAEPIVLRHRRQAHQAAFDPLGRWIVTTSWSEAGLAFWPKSWRTSITLSGHANRITGLVFLPGGRRLLSGSYDGAVRIWPIGAVEADQNSRPVYTLPGGRENKVSCLAASPDGRRVAVGSQSGELHLLAASGAEIAMRSDLYRFVEGVTFDASGNLLAVRGGFDRARNHATVWNVATNDATILDAGDGAAIKDFRFVGQDLVTSGDGGLRRWNLSSSTFTTIHGGRCDQLDIDATNQRAVLTTPSGVLLLDLETGAERRISSSGSRVALSESGDAAVILEAERAPRVISLTDGSTHILPADPGDWAMQASVSPDGRWIVIGYVSGLIRVFPVPDFSRPSLESLPHDELLAKLDSFTNLRAVRDETSATGWTIEVGPFPGWEDVPTW